MKSQIKLALIFAALMFSFIACSGPFSCNSQEPAATEETNATTPAAAPSVTAPATDVKSGGK